MDSRQPEHKLWTAERAYEKALQAGWTLFFIAIPVITLMAGCMGCMIAGNRRNFYAIILTCFAFVLTHLFFIVGVSMRKRWGIVGLLILCGIENLVLISWMILIFFNLGWRKELIGSLTMTLVFLAAGSVMALMYWNIIRASMATRHAILENDPPGFEVIMKSADPSPDSPEKPRPGD